MSIEIHDYNLFSTREVLIFNLNSSCSVFVLKHFNRCYSAVIKTQNSKIQIAFSYSSPLELCIIRQLCIIGTFPIRPPHFAQVVAQE